MGDANCSVTKVRWKLIPSLDSESGGPVVAFVTPKSTFCFQFGVVLKVMSGVTNAMTYGK